MDSVLVVDDEQAILFIFRMLLEDAGFAVETAASAKEAIQKLSERAFDLVVTDIRMETATAGFDVVKTARQLQPAPIIVVVTAFPLSPDAWKNAGADELLMKGADSRNLPDVLKALLQKHRGEHVGSRKSG